MAAKRAEVMAANPEMKPTLIAIEIGKNWRVLPEADRAPHVAQDQVDTDRYAPREVGQSIEMLSCSGGWVGWRMRSVWNIVKWRQQQ